MTEQQKIDQRKKCTWTKINGRWCGGTQMYCVPYF